MDRTLRSHALVTGTQNQPRQVPTNDWTAELGIEPALVKVRAWIALARSRPHDALATAILSAMGAYFALLGYLLVLSGPGE
jgi:hypothetical protein